MRSARVDSSVVLWLAERSMVAVTVAAEGKGAAAIGPRGFGLLGTGACGDFHVGPGLSEYGAGDLVRGA